MPEHHFPITTISIEPSKMSDSADSEDVASQSESEGSSEETLRGDSDSENENDSGPDNRGGGFFDLEAADSDDGTSEESEDDSDASSSEEVAEPLFPRFMYLPAELRRRVWEFFCPEVLRVPRILEFVWDMSVKDQPVLEGASTSNATETVRALAAVDRETREIALRAFPDVLKLSDRRGDVRFNPVRDVVMLDNIRHFDRDNIFHLAPGFSDKLENLAVDLDTLRDMSKDMRESLSTAFPKLYNVYFLLECPEFELTTVWASLNKTNRYTLRTVDDTAGLMRQEERQFMWPSPVNSGENNGNDPPKDSSLSRLWTLLGGGGGHRDYLAQMWPMIEVMRDENWCDSDQALDYGSEDEDASDSAENVDGYEADEIGMYANPVSYATGETDSEEDLDGYEDDFVVDDDLVEYDEDGSDALDGESGGEESDGEPGYPTLDHPGADTLGAPANFSDLEPESDEGAGEEGEQGSEDGDESGSEGDVREVAVRSRARRMVMSDEEEDDDEDTRQGPAGRRGRPVVISEDEDEDEDDGEDARPGPARRRGRPMVISEDEDEDE